MKSEQIAVAPEAAGNQNTCFPFDRRALDECRLSAARSATEMQLLAYTRRSLIPTEIKKLMAQGNTAEDWKQIHVFGTFATDSIVGNRFEGAVALGTFEQGRDAVTDRSPGIFYSTLSNCTIGSGCRISHCSWLGNYLVGPGAVIENVGRISMRGGLPSGFGNDLELFHEELFSRRLRAVAELPFNWAAWITGPQVSSNRAEMDLLNSAADSYAAKLESPHGYIAPGVRITSTPVIESCWIGRYVEIDAAGSLRDSTIWAEHDEPTLVRDGAQTCRALVGPGCTLENMGSVESSILFEHVFVGTKAIVRGCAIGPNTRLSGSEANDSLLGPFTMAVHHGLILAAWWPQGKGNIAYGSNVGSNHTGRAPDQEIWPGEGTFFGLGCNIKFPANFHEAPHTIIATGVDTLPQKVSFPFSLISPPAEQFGEVSPALNEIRPGWGLLQNAYGIERHERNLANRNRATRTPVEVKIFRRDLVDSFLLAMERLKLPEARSRSVYTEQDIPGLGKNVLTEEARIEAIKAYDFGLRFGAARCLFHTLNGWNGSKADGALAPPNHQTVNETDLLNLLRWAATLLRANPADSGSILQSALAEEKKWSELVRSSRARDDQRGRAIFEDYEERHFCADRDPYVAGVGARLEALHASIEEFSALLDRWRLAKS